jgi:hypothetical protein
MGKIIKMLTKFKPENSKLMRVVRRLGPKCEDDIEMYLKRSDRVDWAKVA